MILSDITIGNLRDADELYIEGAHYEKQLQPASVDITLGNSFCCLVNKGDKPIELSDKMEYKSFTVDDSGYVLNPLNFILATTREYIRLPNNLTAFVEGRSSIGRLGLFIQNAGWVDPGFEGEITLELFNASNTPINLRPGTRIGQLVFAQLDRDALCPYRGKYQNQKGATGSRIYMDFTQK